MNTLRPAESKGIILKGRTQFSPQKCVVLKLWEARRLLLHGCFDEENIAYWEQKQNIKERCDCYGHPVITFRKHMEISQNVKLENYTLFSKRGHNRIQCWR